MRWQEIVQTKAMEMAAAWPMGFAEWNDGFRQFLS